MATKGKSLEELVGILERTGMPGAEIKVRDKIFDKIAKELREVDVSVRFRIGSHNFLIIFECRDRSRPNGPDWIEQIIQKTRDLGANKVIAVSASGFTKGAIEKAKHYDIELRALKEITSKDIIGISLPGKLPVLKKRYAIFEISLQPKTKDPKILASLQDYVKNYRLDPNIPTIFINSRDPPISINELFLNTNLNEAFKDLPKDGSKVRQSFTLEPENPTIEFKFSLANGQIAISRIHLVVDLWVEQQSARLESMKSYSHDEKTLFQLIRYDNLDFPDGKRSLEFLFQPSSDGNKLGMRFITTKKG
jgi:hypothetical protein